MAYSGFFRWYLEGHNVEKSGLLMFTQYREMVWFKDNDSLFPYILRQMTCVNDMCK